MEKSRTLDEAERSLKNKRERERVKVLQNQFMDLRKRLPDKAQAKTRLQILKQAAVYIDYLERTIQELNEEIIQKGETELNRPSCRYSVGPTVSYLQPDETFQPFPPLYEFAQTSQEIDWESDFTAQRGVLPNGVAMTTSLQWQGTE